MGLPLGTSTVEKGPACATTVGHRSIFADFVPEATCRIAPGRPRESVLVRRMEQRGTSAAMPRIATEVVDRAGIETIARFIERMPSSAASCTTD
jgi:hypothetical protein